jgi:hypothetical protein
MPSLAVNVSKKIGAQSEDGAPEHHNAHPGKVLPLRLARGLVLPQAVHVIVVDGVGQRSDERLPARGQKLGNAPRADNRPCVSRFRVEIL